MIYGFVLCNLCNRGNLLNENQSHCWAETDNPHSKWKLFFTKADWFMELKSEFLFFPFVKFKFCRSDPGFTKSHFLTTLRQLILSITYYTKWLTFHWCWTTGYLFWFFFFFVLISCLFQSLKILKFRKFSQGKIKQEVGKKQVSEISAQNICKWLHLSCCVFWLKGIAWSLYLSVSLLWLYNSSTVQCIKR